MPIVPLSSPLYRTAFVVPRFVNLQVFSAFPAFPKIPTFPAFPKIPTFPGLPKIPTFPGLPAYPYTPPSHLEHRI